MSRKFPTHWRMPTEATLARYAFGQECGLVGADHPALSSPAELLAESDIGSREVHAILWRMRAVVRNMREGGHPIAGLSAPEIGESVRISLVPLGQGGEPDSYRDVINGAIEVEPAAPLGAVTAHSTPSSNEAVAKLRVPQRHVITGYDWTGNPIEPLQRSGAIAAVDTRYIAWLENGLHPADVAIADGLRLDYRPPEEEARYEDFLRTFAQNPDPEQDWQLSYPPDQWAAVKAGEFVLAEFIKN